jgi:flagellar motor switch protein FliN
MNIDKVKVKLRAVVGSVEISLSDLEQLGENSIVELNELAGDPVFLYANDKLVSMGEIVVVNEKYGVRIIEVIKDED